MSCAVVVVTNRKCCSVISLDAGLWLSTESTFYGGCARSSHLQLVPVAGILKSLYIEILQTLNPLLKVPLEKKFTF